MLHKLRSTICIVTHLPRDTFPLFALALPMQWPWKKRGQSGDSSFPLFLFLLFFPPSVVSFSPLLFCFPVPLPLSLFFFLSLFFSFFPLIARPFFAPPSKTEHFYASNYFMDTRRYRGRAATRDCKLREIFRGFFRISVYN